MDEESPKNFTINKFVIAIVLFIGLGFVITTTLSYYQGTSTQSVLEQRATVGDALFELNKQQSADIKLLTEKLDALTIKLENLEKAGKSIR